MSIEIDYSDIVDIFKTHLKIDNSVKSIAHTFFNERYAGRIDYCPYFQRKYVWDTEKASYFIESILLGTEIPPIVLFDNGIKNEVIDGRQRYETIKRFVENKLSLNAKGLRSLTGLSGRYYNDLPDEIKENFKNTKIRVLQFCIVNEPALSPNQEDKIKKEIFKRYNSGIIALKPQEVERAAYINDPLVHLLKGNLERDSDLLNKCQLLFMPKTKQNLNDREKINYILSRARIVLAMRYIPIQSFAAASSKSDVVRNSLVFRVEKEPKDKTVKEFKCIVNILYKIRCGFLELKSTISDNTLFYETMFWGLSIVQQKDIDITKKLDTDRVVEDFFSCDKLPWLWGGISVEKREFDMIFFATGSHFYKSIINRYSFVANYFSHMFDMDFAGFIKNKSEFDKLTAEAENSVVSQYKEYKLSKNDPVSATVYDILNDVKSSRFIIRPDYQRSEVSNNIQKASYLLESILLGIRIPPIFIYRSDNVSEVIDGQQRILSILGFLKESYIDENGSEQQSNKHGFQLSKLRFLSELNGKDIDGIENINKTYKDRILDFQIDIVEINKSQNPNFDPIDLFLRLNSKPFPIEENTFEMWNSYIPKEYAQDIKDLAAKYSSLFKANDTRMKNEELITMLAFLAYLKRTDGTLPDDYLDIFVRNHRLTARFSKKNSVTNWLSNLQGDDNTAFIDSLNDVETFIIKLRELTGDRFQNFNQLIGFTQKNTQSKTNQNFYILWVILSKIDISKIKAQRDEVFNKIHQIFIKCSDIKDDNFELENFMLEISKI